MGLRRPLRSVLRPPRKHKGFTVPRDARRASPAITRMRLALTWENSGIFAAMSRMSVRMALLRFGRRWATV